MDRFEIARLKKLSREEKIIALRQIEELEKQIALKERQMKDADPFWFYEPSDGSLTEEAVALVRRWIKPDDIPVRFEGQKDIHMCMSPIIGASGANQSGKSVFACLETLIKVTKEIPLSMREWYPKDKIPKKDVVHYRVIAQDYTNGIEKNVLPTYRYWTPREYLLNGVWEDSYKEKSRTLSLYRSGRLCGTIEFMSNEQELSAFMGPPRDGIVFDEEPSWDVYRTNLSRMTTADKRDILFAMTPEKGMSWVFHDIVSKKDAEGSAISWFKISSVTNKKANLQVVEENLKSYTSEAEVKMRLLGEFVSMSGLVYGSSFNQRLHVIEPFETKCTCKRTAHADDCPYRKYLTFLGMDPHATKDSCAVFGVLDRENNFFVDTCYKKGVDVEELKTDINNILEGRRYGWGRIDPSSNTNSTIYGNLNIYKMCKRGENRIPRLQCGDKYSGSIEAGINIIKGRLKLNPISKKPTLFIMDRPENQELIQSFKTMQKKEPNLNSVSVERDKILESAEDHHACLRYIMQARLNWHPLEEYSASDTMAELTDEELIAF